MKAPKILCIGLNTIDLQFMVDAFPEANTKTKASKNTIAAGGPATNAAIAAAHLGANVTLLSPIGKHSLSRFIKDDIESYGVKVIDPIERIESKPIFASIITTEINGERTIFSYHPPKNDKLFAELNHVEEHDYDIVLIDGFYLDLAIPFAKFFKEKGIETVLDGGSWKPGMEELLPFIKTAINSNDFTPPLLKGKNAILNYMHLRYVENVAITRGENSILISEKGKQSQVAVQSVEAVDTLGAGDIFHGAYCYYSALGQNFQTALSSASKIAAQSCLSFGSREWMKQK